MIDVRLDEVTKFNLGGLAREIEKAPYKKALFQVKNESVKK